MEKQQSYLQHEKSDIYSFQSSAVALPFCYYLITHPRHFIIAHTLTVLLPSTDVQQEEYANFLAMSDELDDELMKCLEQRKKHKPMDDSSAKTLFQMKNANMNRFLAGSKKLVAKRKGDAALNDQYYKIMF